MDVIKEETKAKIEMLLLKPIDGGYEVLISPAKKMRIGTRITVEEGKLGEVCTEKFEEGIHDMMLNYEGILEQDLDDLGEMPLPSYIKEKLDDIDRYQTGFTRESVSAAAATAGLHFTETLLKEFQDKGVEIVYITL